MEPRLSTLQQTPSMADAAAVTSPDDSTRRRAESELLLLVEADEYLLEVDASTSMPDSMFLSMSASLSTMLFFSLLDWQSISFYILSFVAKPE